MEPESFHPKPSEITSGTKPSEIQVQAGKIFRGVPLADFRAPGLPDPKVAWEVARCSVARPAR